jgi:myo-inositol 2-dehydrogenase/D-chiro-inositol 1-dehydrogenase
MTARIAIIGAGHMGRIHAQNLSRDERVQLVAIEDIVPGNAEKAAVEYSCAACASLDEIFAHKPDAVYVTTPNALHLEPVMAALERGIHVFSEKPMATDLKQAKQILDAVERTGLIYQIGFNRRFAPVYKFVRDCISQGFKPFSANVKMNRGELLNPPWVGNTALTGGFLYESTIHLLDMIRWLMGEVAEVYCRAEASVYKELDDFSAILTFESGHHAVFSSCAHCSWAFPFEKIELYGEHASLVTEEMEKVTFSPALKEQIITSDCFQLSPSDKWGYVEEDRLFVDALIGEGFPPVKALDGYHAVELSEAMYRSARTGKPVRLPLEI